MNGQETREVLALAVALHRDGRIREALQIYATIRSDASEYAEAQNLMGVSHLQLGSPTKAVQFIETAIATNPRLDEGHYNLGVAHQVLCNFERAIDCFGQAIAINPSRFRCTTNLGVVLQALKRHADAAKSYEAAIALKPQHAGAHLNLSSALHSSARFEEALRHSERAVALNPGFIEAHLNRGSALQALGRNEEAARSFLRAIELKPDHAGAHFNCGTNFETLNRKADAVRAYRQAVTLHPDFLQAWQRLGPLLYELGDHENARNANEHTVRLAPRSPQALVNLGAALQALNRPDEAIEKYRAAISLKPDHAAAHANLGGALRLLGRYEETIESCQRALALDPKIGAAEMNLANALRALDRDEEALQHYDVAISLSPRSADARYNKGLCCLHLGKLGEGFDLREARWEKVAKERYPRYFGHPEWNGEALKDGMLLVWGDEGLGDQILCAAMLRDLASRVRTPIVEIERRLVPLLSRSFPALKIRAIDSDEHGGRIVAHVALTSLGRFLRRELDAIPNCAHGYLKADPALTTRLRTRLRRTGKTVVGLSWISRNPVHGAAKSARLADFESVLRLPRCSFVDLQYGDTTIERDAVARELGVTVERLTDIDNTNDIDGLAALISACDVVVTVSNTTAHLAGALGRDTWVFVPQGHARLWYWFKNRDRSPWYPRTHVRHQTLGQSWAQVIAASVPDLAAANPGHG